MEAATWAESSGHNPSNAGEDGLFEFARGLPGKTRLPPPQAYAEKRKGASPSTENFKGTVFHLPEKRETTLIRNREGTRKGTHRSCANQRSIPWNKKYFE